MIQRTHPLLPVLCVYALGVVLGYSCALRPFWIIVATLSLLAVAAVFFRRRLVLLAILLVGLGWLNISFHTCVISPQDLRVLAPEEPALAKIQGQLIETPRIIESVRDDETHKRTLAEVRINRIQFHREDWKPASGRIIVSSAGELSPEFFQGQKVEVDGVLATPRGPLARGLFDYANYLRKKGIYYELRASTEADWQIPDTAVSNPPLTAHFILWARQTLSRGLPPDDKATGLLQAMTLGWKTALTDEVETPFMRSGTMHIFAISGLHIALIAGILLALLRLLRLPRGLCGAILIPLLWFYTAATGWQASALRATVMMTIILGGWSLRRPSNLLNSLAAAALIILIFDPRQLFQASFQLSFGVVLSLSLILPPVQERFLRLLQADPFVPESLVPRWKRWLGWPLRWILLMVATSLAAWIGSLMLTAHYFHLLSPGTLLANVLIVPCATAALASALASLALGAWWPWASEVFNHGAWFWMRCMMGISERVSNLPGAFYYVKSPSSALIGIYYGTLLVLAFGWLKQRQMKWFLGGSCVLIASLVGWQAYQAKGIRTLTVLPLNGGLSVVVDEPNVGGTMLVDCGNTQTFDSVLTPFLHAQGKERIGSFFITHGDIRHMGAAASVLRDFEPRMLAVSDVRFRSSSYRDIVDGAISEPTILTNLSSGDSLVGWTVLYPPANLKVTRADQGVMVLQGQMGGATTLLLSDLDRDGQRRLLDQVAPEQMRSDIVVTGLPDQGEPLIQDLLDAIRPVLIIVGDDEWPPSRRGTDALYERLRDSSVTVLNTRLQGAIELHFDDNGWKATDAKGDVLAQSDSNALEPPF